MRLQLSLYQLELGSRVSRQDVKVGTENPESHWLEEQGDKLGATTAAGKCGETSQRGERWGEGSHSVDKLSRAPTGLQTRQRVQLRLKEQKRFVATHLRVMAFSV